MLKQGLDNRCPEGKYVFLLTPYDLSPSDARVPLNIQLFSNMSMRILSAVTCLNEVWRSSQKFGYQRRADAGMRTKQPAVSV